MTVARRLLPALAWGSFAGTLWLAAVVALDAMRHDDALGRAAFVAIAEPSLVRWLEEWLVATAVSAALAALLAGLLRGVPGVRVAAAWGILGPASLVAATIALEHAAVARRASLPHVLLVSIDTLRADHLGCYGYDQPTSPYLDSLAERGVLFEQAMAQASATLTSHGAMLSSLYPPQLALTRDDGVNDAQHKTTFRLNERVVMLPEVFAALGYDTAAFTGGAFLLEQYGFDQGFSHFAAARTARQKGLSTSLPRLASWLDEWERDRTDDDRLFLFVHTFDTHDPYQTPAPPSVAFSNGGALAYAAARGFAPSVPVLREQIPEPTPADIAAVVALYDDTIRYVDDQLAALEQDLRERDLWNEMLVVVVSDHGEEFHDHGDWGHGPYLFEELLHVPWIVRWPGDRFAGRRVETPVQLVDLGPTLTDALALPTPTSWRGRSLMPLVRGDGAPELSDGRSLYADIPNAAIGRRALREDQWKLVWDPSERAVDLYDLARDPRERVDVAPRHPRRTATMQRTLTDWLAELQRSSVEFGAIPMPEGSANFQQAQLEMLRELGYVR